MCRLQSTNYVWNEYLRTHRVIHKSLTKRDFFTSKYYLSYTFILQCALYIYVLIITVCRRRDRRSLPLFLQKYRKNNQLLLNTLGPIPNRQVIIRAHPTLPTKPLGANSIPGVGVGKIFYSKPASNLDPLDRNRPPPKFTSRAQAGFFWKRIIPYIQPIAFSHSLVVSSLALKTHTHARLLWITTQLSIRRQGLFIHYFRLFDKQVLRCT